MKFINTENTYKQLQPFETIEQLNANVKAIRDQYADELSPATRNVLDVLNRYASKYYGVCYLSKNKIADMLGVSRRTVIRACNRLEELGAIVQYEMDRPDERGQTVNAIVFVTQINAREAFVNEPQEIANVTGDVTPLNAPLDAKKDIKITDDTERVAPLLKTGLVTKLPKTLKNALAPFFDAEELYEFAGIVFKAKAAVDRTISLEDYDNDYYHAILSVINAYKRNKVDNLRGLLYHAIRTTTQSISLRNQLSAKFGF